MAKAASVRSRLFSPSDIQSIMKKAMVRRLQDHYHREWFPEDGAAYPLRVFLKNDVVTVGHRHVRRCPSTSGATGRWPARRPSRRTLAAALILLTPWNRDRILVDPFCGSGTFPIEAAMMAADIAPGMNRSFTAEAWTNLLPRRAWYDAVDEASSRVRTDVETDIQGYDIDGDVIKVARRNAREAGVDHLIHFQERDVRDLAPPEEVRVYHHKPALRGSGWRTKKTCRSCTGRSGESFAWAWTAGPPT